MLLRGKDGKSGVLALSKGLNDFVSRSRRCCDRNDKTILRAKDHNSGARRTPHTGIGTVKDRIEALWWMA